jgi:putative flippase GtrA
MVNYLSVVALCVVMNVGFLKFFVEILQFYPLPSRLITSVIVVATSYYLQRIYAFKVHKSRGVCII